MERRDKDVSRRSAVAAGVGLGVIGAGALAAAPAGAADGPVDTGYSRPPRDKDPVDTSVSRDRSVISAQRRLTALGYWCGTPDGSFGHLTQQAVWAVQKAAGISRTGKLDDATWRALGQEVRPRPRAGTGVHIQVNLGRQLLMIVNGSTLVMALNTSTGSGERYYSRGSWHTAYTPTGSYKIYYRWPNGWQNGSLGAMWRPTYFTGGWAVHGSESIPPYPASHGCCRLSTKAHDLLWAKGWVDIGRTVWVY